MAMGTRRGGSEAGHSSKARARGPRGLRRERVWPRAKPASRPSSASASVARCKMAVLGRTTAMQLHDKAPEFTLSDEKGQKVSLADFRGKTVVLYFFPRADTPG